MKYLTCQLPCLSPLLIEDKVWTPLDTQDLFALQIGWSHSSQLEQPSELVDLWIGWWTDLWVSVIEFSSLPFRCIRSDMCIIISDWYGWWQNDHLFSLFHRRRTIVVWVIDRHLFLETFWCISSLCIRFQNISISSVIWVVPRIRAKAYIYLMCVAKDNRIKFILNPFSW